VARYNKIKDIIKVETPFTIATKKDKTPRAKHNKKCERSL